MEKINRVQLRCIKALITKLKLPDADAVVLGFSPGCEGHVSRMQLSEATALIAYLKANDPDEQKAAKMRRKIIAYGHEMGWHEPGTRKVDMARVNGWCTTYGAGKKALNGYTLAELPKLVSQMEIVYKQFLKGV